MTVSASQLGELTQQQSHAHTFSFGVVDEYNSDRQYNFTAHVDALLTFFERMVQSDVSAFSRANNLRSRFSRLNQKGWHGMDNINLINKDVRSELEKLTPDGFFFGNARYNSNFVGYWPAGWQQPLSKVPTDFELKQLPKCTFNIAANALNNTAAA